MAAQDRQAPASARPAITIADRIREEFITVVANGVRERLDANGQSVTIFGREEIEAVQGADLTRLLERAPGVALSRNGGAGGFTAVRVRGAEGEQLLTVIDGVRVADPASPGGGFDFGNLLLGNLAKVELQRGSNSTIWGSQALGGVMVVTTGGGSDGGPIASGSAEYGAHDTRYATAGFDGSAGPLDLHLQGGRYVSDGFSSAAAGSEPDGFRQSELSGRARVDLGAGVAAFATARYAKGRLEIDGFPAPAFVLADTAETQDTRQRSGAAGLAYFGSELDLRATLSGAETERRNFDPAAGPGPSYTTDGGSRRADLRGLWAFARGWSVAFGGEREWTRFATLFDSRRRTAIAGAYAQLGYDRGSLHLAAGLRRDRHRDFGGAWSAGADAAVALSDRWRLTASYGEGFKASTLFQLHSDFGNIQLRPERSRSYDLGVAWGGGAVEAKLTAFRRDTRDLIGFVSCFGLTTGLCLNRPFGTYDNLGRARAHGIEAEATADLRPGLTATAAYTWLEAEDRTTGSVTFGKALPRRPRQTMTLSSDWQPALHLRFGADLRLVSASYDDAANAVRLGGFGVLTLRGEWDASEHLTLYGRVENLWDETYQTAAGYASPGRGAYLGARVRL